MVLTKLKEIMDKRGLKVEEVAAKALLSARSIANAQKGRGVSLTTGKRIAISLKMKLEDLT
jgi:DNA-binding Xre family transcriptional regulator